MNNKHGSVGSNALRGLNYTYLFAAAAFATSHAHAQSTLITISGNSAGARYGSSVADGFDINADGVTDVVAGNPGGAGGSLTIARSGVNGGLLWSKAGGNGSATARIGDSNGDGVPDLCIGDPSAASLGAVNVISGANGNAIFTINGKVTYSGFPLCTPGYSNVVLGTSLGYVGDINADGKGDFAAGDPGLTTAKCNGGGLGYTPFDGAVFVFSGANGAILQYHPGAAVNQRMGTSVAGIGDVNLDGIPDVAGLDVTGAVFVWSGKTAAQIYKITGFAQDFQGTANQALSGVSDANLDGISDFAAGASIVTNAGVATGKAAVCSGANGAALQTWFGDAAGDRFGWAVAALGDINNDGRPDAAVGAPQNSANSGYVRIFSCADGSIIYTLPGTAANEQSGFALRSSGDVDLDGFLDITIGAPLADLNFTDSGSARVVSLVPAGIAFFGFGVAGCAGQHLASAANSPKIGNPAFSVTCSKAPPNALGLLLASALPDMSGPDSFGLGIPMYADIINTSIWASADTEAGPLGYAIDTFSLPYDPSLIGMGITFQYIWLWSPQVCSPTASGLSDSNAVQATVLGP
ncbi:MAG: VCBS repeat-containing protein [Planctomycetes bacterium]|nr:VCBS repeat-containing protein [Planctomycetota bacterium]